MSARPYLPSNGTEGEIFMGQWCAACALDCYGKLDDGQREERRELGALGLLDWADIESEPECDILANAFAGLQPEEWVEDERGPRCTAFRLDGDADEGFDPQGALGLLL